jgi:hypothetical protein
VKLSGRPPVLDQAARVHNCFCARGAVRLTHGGRSSDLAEYDRGDYDSWREVGQVIHHETRGSDEGLDVFIKYSRCLSGFYNGAEPGEEGCRIKWRSFGKSPVKPVTFGTLRHRLATLKRSGTGEIRNLERRSLQTIGGTPETCVKHEHG